MVTFARAALRLTGLLAVLGMGVTAILGSEADFTTPIDVPQSDDFTLAVQDAAINPYASPVGVSVHRGQLSGPFTFSFESQDAQITGSFIPNPLVQGENTQLQLQVPARYAAGGIVPARVTAVQTRTVDNVAVTRTHTQDFTLRLTPILTIELRPTFADLTTAAPLDVMVTLAFDPFGPIDGIGHVDLTAVDLPPGVTAQFLPDATVVDGSNHASITRTLHLVTDGTTQAAGNLTVRATAGFLPADATGARPFVEVPLNLNVVAGKVWEFVNTGATYSPLDGQPIGLARQSTGLPVLAWIEGPANERKVYAKRYNGALWDKLPTTGDALAEPTSIDEATAALASGDVPRVAYTFRDASGAAHLRIASVSVSGWTQQSVINAAAGSTLDTPRFALASGGAESLAYVLGTAPTARSLFVTQRATPSSPWSPLAGPQPDGSINRDSDGRVVPGSTGLAVAPSSGDLTVTWIEQPASSTSPATLWIRRFVAGAWSPASPIRVSSALAPAPTQVVVDGAGHTYVAWLEGNPVRVFVAGQADPQSGVWVTLPDSRNIDGALNITSSTPARDIALILDNGGRPVVAWAEGTVKPQLWAKRADVSGWEQLGAPVDPAPVAMRVPRIAPGAAGTNLYLAYSRNLPNTPDLSLPYVDADVFVVRWPY